ncbi:Transposase DDE domain protein [Bacteroidales bacterium Barb4]|nr:Transposase DDE domain protein [Bacteroidales bacterium Barb4]
MSFNSELQLFGVIKGTCPDNKTDRSVYNRRRRKLFDCTEKIRRQPSQKFSCPSNLFIIDSTPVEICKTSRANRSSICTADKIRPEFGYCAAAKTHCFGFKLHAVCDENAVIHSFDFTPASVHDVNYLKM